MNINIITARKIICNYFGFKKTLEFHYLITIYVKTVAMKVYFSYWENVNVKLYIDVVEFGVLPFTHRKNRETKPALKINYKHCYKPLMHQRPTLYFLSFT